MKKVKQPKLEIPITLPDVIGPNHSKIMPYFSDVMKAEKLDRQPITMGFYYNHLHKHDVTLWQWYTHYHVKEWRLLARIKNFSDRQFILEDGNTVYMGGTVYVHKNALDEHYPNWKNEIAVKMHDVVDSFTKNSPYSVDREWESLIEWIEEKNEKFNLDPDYQRHHVWTEEQQIAYVEYAMRGGISGRDLYFNRSSWDAVTELVDGKQRLEAVRRFVNNEFKAHGYYCHQYFNLDDFKCRFKIHINDLKTRKEVLKWYLDLNTGGTQHTNAEIEKVKKLFKDEQ